MSTTPITTFPGLLQAMAPACAPRRNEIGRLVRVEFVRIPTAGHAPVTEHVALFFDEGLRPVTVRTYQPQRRD